MKNYSPSEHTGTNSWSYSIGGKTITLSSADVEKELSSRERETLQNRTPKRLRMNSKELTIFSEIMSDPITGEENQLQEIINHQLKIEGKWAKGALSYGIYEMGKRIRQLKAERAGREWEKETLASTPPRGQRRVQYMENLAAGRWPNQYK